MQKGKNRRDARRRGRGEDATFSFGGEEKKRGKRRLIKTCKSEGESRLAAW